MTSPGTGPGKKCRYCSTERSAGKITRIVLWLIAICIVSFTAGFGILALAGVPLIQNGFSVMPFNDTMFHSPETAVIPMDGITKADVSIKFGTGDLKVKAGTDSPILLQSTAYMKDPDRAPVIRVSSSGPGKSVTVDAMKPGETGPVNLIFPKVLDISLNPKVPLALSARSGAGNTILELGSLNLTSLSVNGGAGDLVLDLSDYNGSTFSGTVSLHAGDLTIRVPKRGSVTIAIEQGIGHVSNNGLVMEQGLYTTGRSAPGQPVISLSVEQGAGSVNLEAV